MKAAIYNPYLDTLGGGERYSMAVATALAKGNYRVDVEWPDLEIKGKLEARFGIKLNGVNFVGDVKRGDGYDICFWVSDGSIPLLRARKNLLHFQFPFKGVNGKTLLNKMKLWRIDKIICNSAFTKSFIDEEFGVKSRVIYPPVDVEGLKPKRKEKLIISVGRFSQLTQVKRQDFLTRVFRKFSNREARGWKLVLAGGAEVGAEKFVRRLKRLAKGYPIEIIESPEYRVIKDLYGRAKIFWSASGYGVDEKKEPTKVEHFGITVVEAMAAGAVPVVFEAGGHKEIVNNGENGYLWNSTRSLLSNTKRLIKQPKLLRSASQQARNDSGKFSYEEFDGSIWDLIK